MSDFQLFRGEFNFKCDYFFKNFDLADLQFWCSADIMISAIMFTLAKS